MCQVLFWVLEMQLTTHTFFCPHEASILGEDTHNKRLSNTMQSSNNCSEEKIKQLKMVESSQDSGTIPQGGWAREGSSEEGTFDLRPEKNVPWVPWACLSLFLELPARAQLPQGGVRVEEDGFWSGAAVGGGTQLFLSAVSPQC